MANISLKDGMYLIVCILNWLSEESAIRSL